jgi:HSP20 family molecular chaperone IbpA
MANIPRFERSDGVQLRAFRLLHEIDQARAEAKYSDGVLEPLPRRLPLQHAS